MIDRKLSNGERRWLILFCVLVVVITCLPYLRAWMSQGNDWAFTGFLIGVEDGNSYIAKMLLGDHGGWLFRSPYSTETQSGAIVFLPYLLLGKINLAADQHTNLMVVFHLYRIIGVLLLCWSTFTFVAYFIKSPSMRKWATALAIGGGGLGWVLLLLGQQYWLGSLPLEFYSPESFGFLSAFGIPHLAVSRALLLFGIVAFLDRRFLHAGALWSLMGFFQPVTVIIGWAVIGAYLSVQACLIKRRSRWAVDIGWSDWKRNIRGFLGTIVLSSPMVVYSTVIFWIDPYLKAWKWEGQNTITSPHFFHYLVAYGGVFLVISLVIRKIIEKVDNRSLFLIVWIAISPLLIYFPVDFQRRLADGVWIALVVLMLKGIELAYRKLSGFSTGTFSFIFISSIMLWLGAWGAAGEPSKPTFLPSDQVEAFTYISENIQEDSIILSSYQTGNALPAWARVRVILGHGPESINLLSSLESVRAFFDAAVGDQARREFILQQEISYLFYGPDEKSLGDWDPKKSPFMQLLFDNDQYAIYSVSSNPE